MSWAAAVIVATRFVPPRDPNPLSGEEYHPAETVQRRQLIRQVLFIIIVVVFICSKRAGENLLVCATVIALGSRQTGGQDQRRVSGESVNDRAAVNI